MVKRKSRSYLKKNEDAIEKVLDERRPAGMEKSHDDLSSELIDLQVEADMDKEAETATQMSSRY